MTQVSIYTRNPFVNRNAFPDYPVYMKVYNQQEYFQKRPRNMKSNYHQIIPENSALYHQEKRRNKQNSTKFASEPEVKKCQSWKHQRRQALPTKSNVKLHTKQATINFNNIIPNENEVNQFILDTFRNISAIFDGNFDKFVKTGEDLLNIDVVGKCEISKISEQITEIKSEYLNKISKNDFLKELCPEQIEEAFSQEKWETTYENFGQNAIFFNLPSLTSTPSC